MGSVGMWLPTLEQPTDPDVAGVCAHNVFIWTDEWTPSSPGAKLRPISTWGGLVSSGSSYVQDDNVYDIDLVPASNIDPLYSLEYCQAHYHLEQNSHDADPGLLETTGAYPYGLNPGIGGLTGFNASWLLAS